MLKYETTIRKLYSANLHQRVKMGLTNITKLLTALESPYVDKGKSTLDNRKMPIIVHVAGTNGKGSVCWKLAQSMRASGLKTGIFVSPHISCFRERVQVDGQYISQEETTTILNKIFDICQEQDIPSTFFEMTTALAFKHFENEEVEAVVLETGLGGRLDSTNVIVPDVSVITSISLDHTKILGNTVEEIAYEKAGIIKPEIPVVVGPRCPVNVFEEVAKTQNSKVHSVVLPSTDEHVDFCHENEEIARVAFNVLKENGKILEHCSKEVDEAMLSLPPCRFQCIESDLTNGVDTDCHPSYLLDVAHNPDAMRLLFKRYNRVFKTSDKLRQPRVVLGFSVDKDVEKCLEIVLENTGIDRIYPVAAGHPRAMDGKVLQDMLLKVDEKYCKNKRAHSDTRKDCQVFNDRIAKYSQPYSISEALVIAKEDRDKELNCAGNAFSKLDVGPIIFCGSLYSMQEAMSHLRVPLPDADPSSVQKAWEERKVGKSDEKAKGEKGLFNNPRAFFEKHDVKKVIKKYGMIGLCFHTTCYICSLGCVYAALQNGFDFPESTAYLRDTLNVSEDAGLLAVAWGVNASLTSVPRSVLTVVATPVIAKKFFGYKDGDDEK